MRVVFFIILLTTLTTHAQTPTVKTIMDVMDCIYDKSCRENVLRKAGYIEFGKPVLKIGYVPEYKPVKDTSDKPNNTLRISVDNDYIIVDYSTTTQANQQLLFNSVLAIGFTPADTTSKDSIIYTSKRFSNREVYTGTWVQRGRTTYHVYITEDW